MCSTAHAYLIFNDASAHEAINIKHRGAYA